VFTCEAEEYAAEGLDCDGQWARVSTACQLPALVLLEGSSSPGAGLGPLGVFGVINDRSRCNFSTEETMSGGASAGSALTDSIANACAGHASFRRGIGRDASRVFGVKHFAGEVFYEAAHFVRKNASAHRPDIVAFLKQHGGSFVREVLAGEGDEQDAATAVTKGPGRPGRKLFGRTLISVFQQELNELCTTLEARQCRHVRCLRPNDEQKPLIFDDVSMLRQCRYSGLLEATRIRKMGYAHRRPLRAFAARYAVLLTDREAEALAFTVFIGSPFELIASAFAFIAFLGGLPEREAEGAVSVVGLMSGRSCDQVEMFSLSGSVLELWEDERLSSSARASCALIVQ
ncbi:unnamed protein product, partial [Polarella glacialis]